MSSSLLLEFEQRTGGAGVPRIGQGDALDTDEGDAEIGALLSAELDHGLRDRHFERGMDQARQEMTAT
jgi:hypothetical protein